MDELNSVRPEIRVLTGEQVHLVHQRSLKLLNEVGVRVDSSQALKVLAGADGAWVEEDRVRLEPSLVQWAIDSARKEIQIYSRLGEKAFCLGRDTTRFGIGVTNLFYQEPDTSHLVPFNRHHMAIGTRLGHSLEAYDLVSTLGVLKDAPRGKEDLLGTLEMVSNTTKPLVLLVSDDDQFLPVINLLEGLVVDLTEKPFTIPYFNPVTPLVLNKGTGDKLIQAIEHGLPVIFSNYGMAGTTTPITPAGSLVLLNAELLFGLVLGQLVRPGASMILGSLPAFFNMKTMLDFYDPRTILLNAACAEMMAFYQVPHAGTSGSGLGWGMGVQAAGLHCMNHVLACLGKSGMAPFVGSTLDSKAFSPASVVYANDVILQARWLAEGFVLNNETVGLEELLALKPGDNFLNTRLTRMNYKTAYYESRIFPSLSLEKWLKMNEPGSEKYLVEKTMQLIAEAEPPIDHDGLLQQGEEFIGNLALKPG